MKSIVELTNVSKVIGKRKIIDDLSFSVQEGEVFGFLGPNGAGKTTTIRMIAGLIGISSGKITVCGNDVEKEFEQSMEQIGAIVENPEMYKFLSGYENLQQAARLHKKVTKAKINEVIELVGLEERIHDKVKTYSLGMRQRLGIAQSLLHDPKVLILDEPTNGLDPAGIREIRDYLRTLAKERGMAIIVSSHLLSEMEMMCDRIAILQKGRLVDVQMVKTESEDQSVYAIQAENDQAVLTYLNNKGLAAEKVKGSIEVTLDKAAVPDFVIDLVQNGARLTEFKRVNKSLEDRFLEITNGAEVKKHA